VKTVTLKDVMNWNPCYIEERIKELFAGRETLSAIEILDLDIPAEDRVWALLHNEFFSERELQELACDFAESTLHIYEEKYPNDDRPRVVIETARRYIRGRATKEELDTVRYAAQTIPDIAKSIIMTATRIAVKTEAETIAWTAANLAVIRVATKNAEREKQLNIIQKKLRSNVKGRERVKMVYNELLRLLKNLRIFINAG